MIQRITLITVTSILFIGCASLPKKTPQDPVKPEPVQSMNLNTDLDSLDNSPSLEDIFSQAKVHYADALIAVYDNDTTGARYEFEQALEALRQVQDADSLEPWAQDESILLTQKITEDYVQFQGKSGNDTAEETEPTSIQERIALLEPVEEVESEAGEFKVLDDREGHVPIILNSRVERIIHFFQNQGRDDFQQWLNRIDRFKPLITGILKEDGVPPELFYLALIESGLNPNAYSYAHAVGPWQFISSTGKLYGLERNWWIDERRDPVKSTHAAAKYLNKLYNEFDDWYLALAAYNSGERRVWRAIRREGTRDFWRLRTLPRQTRNYIPTFLAAVIIAHNPEKYDFEITPEPVWAADTVKVDKSYDLSKVAQAVSTSVDELRVLNPEIRRWVTPPNRKDYVLRVPKGSRDKLEKALSDIPEAGVQNFVTHRVRYGETLSSIATKYHVSISSIAQVNNIRNSHWIRVGQSLTIPINGYTARSSTATSNRSVPGKTRVTYLVRRGDTLGAIAELYHTRANSIRRWNGLHYGEYIYPGQRLSIWVSKNSQFVQKNTTTKDGKYQVYVVQPGDTLWDIARRHGVDVDALKTWNIEMASGYIKPGDKIKILVN